MSHQDSEPEEAITKEEIEGKAPVSARNAFTELMTPKRKAPPSAPPPRMSRGGNPFRDRMGLGAYLEDPASYPSSRVIYHNDSFVAINDRYPKATIHTLLLPRSTKHNLLHPFEAFNDPEFLASVKAETARLRALVVKELQRRLGPESRSDAQRQAVLDGDAEPGESGELPAGRDWDAEVISGVHAVPSMRHLHVHVLSREMYSEALRHRKHYNSFNTPFLVNVDDFPLAADDPRRNTKEEAYLKWNMKCWRCGQDFGNQFQKLKEHLKDEYEMWKKI
ncbi:aprataxin-like protein [Fusarium falciforme]|uniref:Aprataxin-like protein n=1 Tax=Fusarium falciforme TaxID=195108 RepID=A0A9W8R4Y9_9HYPO|nr:aprataxin-like protein [Fusarium falciforme]KAJ4187996.1 aprataxin-like protein [Fusarium falciforme]KAJ4198576.1 aprataxin-like protein [Fusarium falciforme]KAJ4251659.1 aprataxin-like protein [Fusarium falciforme]